MNLRFHISTLRARRRFSSSLIIPAYTASSRVSWLPYVGARVASVVRRCRWRCLRSIHFAVGDERHRQHGRCVLVVASCPADGAEALTHSLPKSRPPRWSVVAGAAVSRRHFRRRFAHVALRANERSAERIRRDGFAELYQPTTRHESALNQGVLISAKRTNSSCWTRYHMPSWSGKAMYRFVPICSFRMSSLPGHLTVMVVVPSLCRAVR